VAALACEPTLLAHAGLATTDVALSACLLAAVYHFRTRQAHGPALRVLLPAASFAALVLAKASGLVFGCLCLAAVEAERLVRQGAWARRPGEGRREALRRRLAAAWPPAAECALVVGLGVALALLYCPSAYQALWYQVQRNAGFPRATGAYLLGRWYPENVWYYFPVALGVKLSLPVLAAPLVLALTRPRSLLNWACLAAGILLAFSLACRVQIGVRLVLPLVALGIVGLAGAAVRACREGGPAWRRLAAGAAAAGVAWTAASALAVWPEGLCYGNELWGGPSRAYLYVSDSNYDWGQGLKELARWQRQRGLATLDVWPVGPECSFRAMPAMRPLHLDALPIRGPADLADRVRGHFLAVSTTTVYGYAIDSPAAMILRSLRPVDRTSTFLIYDFTGAGAPPGPR
jgi:hypothetical protein